MQACLGVYTDCAVRKAGVICTSVGAMKGLICELRIIESSWSIVMSWAWDLRQGL